MGGSPQKIFSKIFEKTLDNRHKVCYTIITEGEGKPHKPEGRNKMYGLTGWPIMLGEDEELWFDTMDELMEFAKMFNITDESELTPIGVDFWSI